VEGRIKVPTMAEIKEALKLPEVNDKTDAMGRVIRKNNYSQMKPNKKVNPSKGRSKYD